MSASAAGPQGDPLDALTLDDPVAEPTESVPVTDAPKPEVEAPPADQSPETQAAVPPADAGPDAAAAIPTPQFVPPTGEPFRFRVDRNEVPLEGAVQTPDGGVYFPPEAWNRVQSNYIGDRSVWVDERRGWRQERAALEAKIQEAAEARSARELEVEESLALLKEVYGNPERAQSLFEQWHIQGPLLQSQAQARAAQRQLAALEAREKARAEQERARALIPEMQDWLKEEVGTALKQEEWKGLFQDAQRDGLLRELWDQHLNSVFYEGRDGRIHLDREKLHELVGSRAEWIRQARVGMQKVEEKKAIISAAIAPTKPGGAAPVKPVVPKVERPRDDAGKFTKLDLKQRKQAARAMLDDLTLEDATA